MNRAIPEIITNDIIADIPEPGKEIIRKLIQDVRELNLTLAKERRLIKTLKFLLSTNSNQQTNKLYNYILELDEKISQTLYMMEMGGDNAKISDILTRSVPDKSDHEVPDAYGKEDFAPAAPISQADICPVTNWDNVIGTLD